MQKSKSQINFQMPSILKADKNEKNKSKTSIKESVC